MKKVTISNLQLVPVRFQEGLTFFASFVLDNKYFIGNIAVYTLKDGSGFRLVYPTKKLLNGEQINLFYPITREVGDQIQKTVSQEAKRLLEAASRQLEGKYLFGTREED